MKRTFKSFFVSALLVLVCLTLVSCVNPKTNIDIDSNAPFGTKYPEKLNATHKINGSMDAMEMYEAGVKNFYEASFTAARQLGKITTDSALDSDMLQMLDCFRIKQDGIYYLDSRSYTVSGSPEIKMCDQSIYRDGIYRVRSAEKKNININDGVLTVKKWPEVEQYSSLAAGLDIYPDDLTKINMFTVNKDTVSSTPTKPIYDAKNKTYKFSFIMNIDTATVGYIPVMEYKTYKGGGFPADTINFKRLKLTVEMWDNGFIKTIANEEAYDVYAKVPVIGSIRSKTTLFSTTYFTYDRAEVNINDYLVF